MDREFGQDFIDGIFNDEETSEEDIKKDNVNKESFVNDHRHSIDGSICHTCKIPHILPFEDITDQEYNQILEFLDSIPDRQVKQIFLDQSNLPQVRTLHRIMEWIAALDFQNEEKARTYATYEFIGYLSTKTAHIQLADFHNDNPKDLLNKIYQRIYLEKQLIHSHIALQQSYYQYDFMKQSANEANRMMTEEVNEFMSLIDTFFTKRLQHCREEYRNLCLSVSEGRNVTEQQDAIRYAFTVDENLIEYGIFSSHNIAKEEKQALYKNIDKFMTPGFRENLLTAIENA